MTPTLTPSEALAVAPVLSVDEVRHPSVEDLRAMGDDGIALDAIFRAARMIGEQNGTVGDVDNTLWGALQNAANRYQFTHATLSTVVAENERLRDEVSTLTTCGVIEVAIRNASVQEYCDHWEGRATRAESENESLRAELGRVRSQLAAYEQAVNRIDDRIEYREFGADDLHAILADLTAQLAALAPPPQESGS